MSKFIGSFSDHTCVALGGIEQDIAEVLGLDTESVKNGPKEDVVFKNMIQLGQRKKRLPRKFKKSMKSAFGPKAHVMWRANNSSTKFPGRYMDMKNQRFKRGGEGPMYTNEYN